ncbi:MAG: hypothetical protein RIS50_1295, partial [Bacteroidota bacterium]
RCHERHGVQAHRSQRQRGVSACRLRVWRLVPLHGAGVRLRVDNDRVLAVGAECGRVGIAGHKRAAVIGDDDLNAGTIFQSAELL